MEALKVQVVICQVSKGCQTLLQCKASMSSAQAVVLGCAVFPITIYLPISARLLPEYKAAKLAVCLAAPLSVA